MLIQPTPMEVELMYSPTQARQMTAAVKYYQELESKGILTLVAAAADLYDKLVPEQDKIDLMKFPEGHSPRQRAQYIMHNLETLCDKYHYRGADQDGERPIQIKPFLIHMLKMGYEQLPVADTTSRFGAKLTWRYFREALKRIGSPLYTSISTPVRPDVREIPNPENDDLANELLADLAEGMSAEQIAASRAEGTPPAQMIAKPCSDN